MVDYENLIEVVKQHNSKNTTAIMFIEELSEVIQGISHLRRKRIDRNELRLEIVQMLVQLDVFLGHLEYNESIEDLVNSSEFERESENLYHKIVERSKDFSFK